MLDSRTTSALRRECHLFSRYLVGTDAHADVVAAYIRAHELNRVTGAEHWTALDRALVRVSGWGPWSVRLADLYSAVFAKTSVLRRKLVLMVAILESRADTAEMMDTADAGSSLGWLVST